MAKVKQVSAVIATWCPHCSPLSVENSKVLAEKLGAAYRTLDIDKEDEVNVADDLVKNYGDDSKDYLIPQIFLEFDDGKVQHIFTGFSENTEVTKKHWNELFQSEFLEKLVQTR
jgi:glutaredoxin